MVFINIGKKVLILKLTDAIQLAYQRQWSMINTFTVQLIMTDKLTAKVGAFGDDINLNIISLQTPDFTNDPIEVFVANQWVIGNGKDSLYRFSITFRDHDQMSLYRKFLKIYNMTKDNYFSDMQMQVIVDKDGDWLNEDSRRLFEFNGTLIEGVSNLSFSNDTENQIAEFTVSFKCTTPTPR